MILVTVGTTLPFDSLIKEIDYLCETKKINDDVLCQIGQGSYIPKHCSHEKFFRSIDQHIEDASLVIGHGGTGTTLDLLLRKKKFIAVANDLANDAHQEKFLSRLSKEVNILWTNDVKDLSQLIEEAQRNFPPSGALNSLTPTIAEYVDSL